MKLLLLLGVVAVVVAALPHPDFIPVRARGGSAFRRAVEEHARATRGIFTNTTPNWYLQQLDHTNPAAGTFNQRYFIDYSAWDGTGPAMIYIEGEGPASSSPSGFHANFARNMSALMVSLEHRFYGESSPGPITNKTLLQYLTVENALADLISFMKYIEHQIAKKPLTWFSVGGSYAGALSAWLKVKYPDAVVAAWSSSGVVNTRFDFTKFDGHIVSTIPPKCRKAIRHAFDLVETAWADPVQRSAVLAKFGTPSYFTLTDMAWMMADGTAMAVQYGMKNELCNSVLPIAADPVQQLAQTIKAIWGASFASSCYYSTYCLSNPAMSSQWAANYHWVFQCCYELAYWQPGYPGSLRLENITTDYFINQCRSVFWPTIFPDTYAFNAKFGGATPKATNVIALQASDDPWAPAGVEQPLGPNYPEFLAQCSGCGHCGDLYPPLPTDPASLVAQRGQIVKYMTQWIQEGMLKNKKKWKIQLH